VDRKQMKYLPYTRTCSAEHLHKILEATTTTGPLGAPISAEVCNHVITGQLLAKLYYQRGQFSPPVRNLNDSQPPQPRKLRLKINLPVAWLSVLEYGHI